MSLFILVLILGIMAYVLMDYEFKQTTYYKDTHNSFLKTKLDLGRNGEYLIYRYLRNYEKKGGKFLFNCYLPRENGQTTEIDVCLICGEGIFVFESKNYSGWIFGDEKSKNWTQTLPRGKGRSHKEHFLNPVMQNKLHIKWLKKLIEEDVPVYSVIVFSERCTLKKVSVESPNIFVINRDRIAGLVKKMGSKQSSKLEAEKIDSFYNILYPYTQVADTVKNQHIADIQKNIEHPQAQGKNRL